MSGLRNFDLTGRVALVTGAAGLLGREHASALLDAGAVVFLADIREAEVRSAVAWLCANGRPRARALTMDVTNRESIARSLQDILRAEGRLDILVNNAAVDPKVDRNRSPQAGSRLEQQSIDDWNHQLDVGLTGAFLCAQILGTHMAAAGGGVILNIASDLSVISPDQRLYRTDGVAEDQQPVKPVSYSVIKTGLIGLTRYLATYWAAQGVRVNALSPGGVFVAQPPDFVDRLVERIPLKRMAQPDEYHGAVQFLCSDASRYMTGQNIVIDGGRSVW